MLQSDIQLSLDHRSSPNAGEHSSLLKDSGDVVSENTNSNSISNISTSHMTVLQKNLIDILSEQRVAYASCTPTSYTTKFDSLPHVLRTSLLKRSSTAEMSSFDGVDVGADYLKNNKTEQNRRALLDLLREMSYTNEGKVLKCWNNIPIIISILTINYMIRKLYGRIIEND
jgi:hypothetical protein